LSRAGNKKEAGTRKQRNGSRILEVFYLINILDMHNENFSFRDKEPKWLTKLVPDWKTGSE
jgi:hypothetical protein